MPRIKKDTLKVKKSQSKKAKADLVIPVYGLDGKEKGVFELAKEFFAVEENPRLLAQYVRVYLANQRQGTASTKTRGEVTGSTRKIYRQKGTGRARHGDIKAPIFVGGGVVGGPKPRDFSLKLSKKQIKKSLLLALTLKFKGKNIIGIGDELAKIPPKTKKIADILKNMGLANRRVLITLSGTDKNNLVLAARNLPNLHILDSRSLNAYDVLKNETILVSKKALEFLKLRFIKA